METTIIQIQNKDVILVCGNQVIIVKFNSRNRALDHAFNLVLCFMQLGHVTLDIEQVN